MALYGIYTDGSCLPCGMISCGMYCVVFVFEMLRYQSRIHIIMHQEGLTIAPRLPRWYYEAKSYVLPASRRLFQGINDKSTMHGLWTCVPHTGLPIIIVKKPAVLLYFPYARNAPTSITTRTP